LIADVVEQKVY